MADRKGEDMELGKKVDLYIVKKTPIGLFLNEDPDELLNSLTLPREEVAELTEASELELGDMVSVYCYQNMDNKIVATTKAPIVCNGEVGYLECVASNHYGAFMDWGYDKDVLLPFNEQYQDVKKGHKVMVGLYTDKTGRLCATQKLKKFLRADCPYEEGDTISGVIYDVKYDMGAFVAVDKKYFGMILSNELMPNMKPGLEVTGRVTKVRDDGKVNITVNKRVDLQMDEDSVKIYDLLKDNDGFLPYNDKSNSDTIRRVFMMSKKAFKRSVGRLYKEKKIEIVDNGIRIAEDTSSDEA